MADRLDVVSVGVEHVGRVVVRVVLGPNARRAVVAPSRVEGRRVEGVDRRTVVALESDVGAADGVATADPEVETARVREVGERALLLVDDPVAERPSTGS